MLALTSIIMYNICLVILNVVDKCYILNHRSHFNSSLKSRLLAGDLPISYPNCLESPIIFAGIPATIA